MSTLLVVILLCAYFVYVPSFSPTTHAYSQGYFGASNNSEPIPNPQVYTLIIDFLNNADVNGSSRYFLVPNTFLSTLNLGGADPYIFGPSLSSPTSQVMQYLGFVDNLVANNETANLGALLAPANVKYVMVIRNSTEPDSTVGTMQGALRQTSLFGLDGDPQLFIDFLSKQKDLKLVAENQYYAAYENLDFLPYIECYSSMTYIEGDLNTIPMLSTLPNYNSNSTLLFFGDDNTNASGSVLDLSNNLLFYNRGATDLLISSMFSDYGVSLTGIGTTDSSKIAENWVWNNDVQSNTGFLTYGNGCLETTSEKSFELPFLIKYPESYGIWARVLYSTYSNGTLTFSVNGVAIDKLLNTQTDTDEGFVWINVSNLTLDQKQYVLTIGNSGGYSALGGIVIAPTGEITNTQNVISENMASKKVLYLYDTDSPFIKVSTNETTTGVNGETTTYTLSAFLPNGEYSMAVESPSVANDSLVNFNLGGNNVQATNRFDNWISSGIIALTGGTYSFSLTLKGNCTADEIAVVAGSLPEFWENQDENFSYITTGYSSYKVTINNTVPLFISLGEAYDPGWQALLSNQPVMHFAAFSFTNGFYVPPEGSATIELTYLPSTNVIFNRIALILFIAVLVGVVVITIYNSSIKKSRALKSKHSINWVMESN